MLKRLIGITVLGAAAGFLFMAPAGEAPEAESSDAAQALVADIHVLRPAPVRDVITGHGQVRARWHSRLSAEVGGRVVAVSDNLLVGAHFHKGELLAEIEDTAFHSAVAAARSTQAGAERALTEEQQRGKLALENWKASGLGGQPTDLTLRRPQLAETAAAVEAARAALQQAEYDLSRTRITAPFDGVVASRSLNPGEVVQAGTQIAEVIDTSVFELTVPLGAAELARLGDPVGAGAVIRDSTGHSWSGQVVRIEPSVDAQNRWINVVVQLQSNASVMPGQFLTAELQGQPHEALYAVPERLISRRGQIWVLDGENLVQAMAAKPVFVTDGLWYITPPDGAGEQLQIAEPRSGFLSGVEVAPRTVEAPLPADTLRAETGEVGQ